MTHRAPQVMLRSDGGLASTDTNILAEPKNFIFMSKNVSRSFTKNKEKEKINTHTQAANLSYPEVSQHS